MARLTSVVFSALSLSGAVLALPTEIKDRAPAYQECPSGSWYYTCPQYGHDGCFSKDPCIGPEAGAPTPTSTGTATASATDTCTDTATTTATATATRTQVTSTPTGTGLLHPCANGKSRAVVHAPTLYNLSPANPDASGPGVDYLSVKYAAGKSELEQAMVFTGLPETATQCQIGWTQVPKRNFTVEKNGSVRFHVLTGFPEDGENISYNAVEPFVNSTQLMRTADHTGWADPVKFPVGDHDNGAVDCAESLFFKLQINELNTKPGDGSVFFTQDADNGFYISYC